jgi:predicted GNAT family acetyltransferase
MWRMVHSEQADAIDPEDMQVQRLDLEHLEDIRGLFVGHGDAPDAFSASQLRTGTFFGVFDGERLAAISGTHVRSTRYRVAAIGNVFTDPLHRGKGYASLTTQAVLNALLADGMDTIVLNVAKSNRAAIKAYQRIGFKPYCGYFEGYGKRI